MQIRNNIDYIVVISRKTRLGQLRKYKQNEYFSIEVYHADLIIIKWRNQKIKLARDIIIVVTIIIVIIALAIIDLRKSLADIISTTNIIIVTIDSYLKHFISNNVIIYNKLKVIEFLA